MGVTQQHISKIERGEFSSVTTLEKVLLYIGYTVVIKAIPLRPKVRNRIIRIRQKGKVFASPDEAKKYISSL